jgi:Fe2+ transport system protein FeoA
MKRATHPATKNLLDFPAKSQVRIIGIPDDLPHELRSHLSAWGLTPGTIVTVLGHRPVTRLAVEHAELALENSVARAVQVEACEPQHAGN